MISYIELLRPGNAVMAAIAVFIGGLIVLGPSVAITGIWLALIAAFLITGAGNAVNDYADVESDKVNSPKRPIPSGRVSRREVLYFSSFLFIVGIALAFFITPAAFLIALINSIILIAYSFWLQNKVFVGNLAISYLVGSTFLFGGAAVGDLILPGILTLLALLVNLSREIVKDLEDIEGDRLGFLKRMVGKIKEGVAERFGVGRKGPALRYSARNARALAFFSLLFAVAISPLPWMWYLLGFSYLIMVIVADVVFALGLVYILRSRGRGDFRRTSRIIKLGMFLGLVAFIAGALV